MEKKDIYVSINHGKYKSNKANLLSAQIDLLNLMKHLQNLKKIKQEKSKLKLELHKLFQNLGKDLKKLETNLPKLPIPKSIRDKLRQTREVEIGDIGYIETPEVIEQPPIETVDQTIEQELREIQEKLRILNSSR